jgi:transcriptional regulator
MYLPAHFRVDDPQVLSAVIREHPLSVMITLVEGLPTADHIPVEIEATESGWQLRGHIARANPMHRHVSDGDEVLFVFRALDAYVSPNWYPSKAQHGKAVPTWNYEAVHVRGRLRWHPAAEHSLPIVTALTDRHESTQPHPWAVTDAPADYLEAMLKAIVGFTVEVTSMVGKFKASQNRSPEDRDGLRRGLADAGLDASTVAALARDPMA